MGFHSKVRVVLVGPQNNAEGSLSLFLFPPFSPRIQTFSEVDAMGVGAVPMLSGKLLLEEAKDDHWRRAQFSDDGPQP